MFLLLGDLRLINPLDFEAYTHHYLDVEVEYANGFIAHSGVVVVVRNVNDNKPQTFPYPSTATINPSFARHTMVGEIDVVDADRERTDKNTFVFSVVGGDPKGIFAISQTGQIYTKRCMSGTDVGIYDLRIKVNDGQFDVYEGFKVAVFDIGDAAFSKSCPVRCSDFGNPTNYMFNEGLKIVNVNEDAAIDTALLSVDINAFPNATFSLSSHAAGYFRVDASNGTIYLNHSLDYETHTVHYFTVTSSIMSRVANVPVTSKMAVMVMVQNVQDVKPMVTSPSLISISELTVPGTIVGYLHAMDEDTPLSSLSFSLNTSFPNALSINSRGEIVSNDLSGVVHNTNHMVFYSVSDSKHTVNGVINFRVVDVNNNVPMFTKNVYSFSINEGVIGNLGSVSASDKDASQSTVTYSIDTVSAVHFIINATTGELRTRTTLDYESKHHHHITVMASDNGGYISVAVATVTVHDVNDNTPLFATSTFSTMVNENTEIGSMITWIKVTDADMASNLTFSWDQSSNYFSISNTGVVTLTQSLYKSSMNVHQMVFTVTDQVHQISGAVTVTVARGSFSTCPTVAGFSTKVLDVPENTSVNAVLMNLGSLVNSPYFQYTFEMATGSPNNFEIVGTNLRLKVAVDYENKKMYMFNVHAMDAIRNTTSDLSILVHVLDIDESSPTVSTTSIVVSEFTQVGATVGMIQASDSDGTASMRFALKNSDGTFSVNPDTGAVTLLKALDGAVKSSYTLKVCVTASGVEICEDITTTVTNTNSNAPTFGGIEKLDISVSSQAVAGTLISNTSATDGDGNPISYSMNALGDSTVFSIFAVDPNTGHITVKANAIPGEYKFFLIAKDGVHERSLPVTIIVPMENAGQDTPPHFKSTVYSVTVFSDAETFVQVQAMDAPDTASLRYSIKSGNTGDVFTIEEMTGAISRTSGKTLTVGSLYKMTVGATNRRSNLTGEVPVYVAVGSRIEGGSSGSPSSFVQEVSATSVLLNMSLGSFDSNHVVGYYIIGQEYPSTIDVTIKTQMEPVTYYQAFNSTNTVLYRFRLYYVANISIADVQAKVGRTRRSVSNVTT